jgi:hypothetical protein
MAAGFPVKADYVTGDVLSAANMNDLAGTLNYLDPTAKGDLFPASSGTQLTRLAVGANNTVLTADSAEATGLKWATPTSGALTLISTTTLSTGTTTISATLTSYKNVFILLKNVYASGVTDMRMRLNADTAANYNTNVVQGSGTSASGRSSNGATAFLIDTLGTGSTVRAALQASMNLYRVNDTNEIVMDFTTRNDDGTDYGTGRGCGVYDSAAIVSSFTFFVDTGTFSGGTVYLYGVN